MFPLSFFLNICNLACYFPRDWEQEKNGTTEDEMAGWHHWLDGRESKWTPGVGDGQGGLACCDSLTERLNWTELNWDQFWGLLLFYLVFVILYSFCYRVPPPTKQTKQLHCVSSKPLCPCPTDGWLGDSPRASVSFPPVRIGALSFHQTLFQGELERWAG